MWAVIKDGDHTLTWSSCFKLLIGKAVKIDELKYNHTRRYYIDESWADEFTSESYEVCDVWWEEREFDILTSYYLNELLLTNHLTIR